MNEMPASAKPDVRSREKTIREVHLLDDERVVGLLDGYSGLVEAPTPQGPLLALTDRRVISLIEAEDRQETHVASIDKVQGVSIRDRRRPQKPLVQGVVLILAGILVYLLVGTFSTGIPVNAGITIGAILGGAVALLGLLYIARYLFWEKGGELIFQTGGLELVFLYNSDAAALAVQQLLRRFFQLQSGQEAEPLYAATPAVRWLPLLRVATQPAPPASEPLPSGNAASTPKPRTRPRKPTTLASRRSRPTRLQLLTLIRVRRGASRRINRRDSRKLARLRLPRLSANGRNGYPPGNSRPIRRRLRKRAAR